jgi:riboflavin kinase/FMN adenylyltransferase
MEVIRSLDNFKPLQGSVLTIGSYDGIHRGHLEIISSIVHYGRARGLPSTLITFEPHPRHILERSNQKLPVLMRIEEKLDIIEKIGIEIVYVINFTDEFSKTTAVGFLDEIVVPFFNPKCIIVGYDHHFGNKREGGPDFLNRYCKEKSIEIEIVGPISDDGHNISSTRIRKLINDGFVRRANFELGSVYGFNAKVVKGAGRGKGLNFPTANVIPLHDDQLMPRSGVYFIRGRFIGQHAFGMCNFGVRPTFEEEDLVMEIHFFLEESSELYGKEIRVEFLERIRDEKKFPSPKDLVKQLNKDKQKCLELKGKYD